MLDALAAVEAAGFGERQDFYATLHAVFVKKHEHTLLFDQAFQIFWRRRGLLEKLIAMLSPQAPSQRQPRPAEAGASRVADALFKSPPQDAKAIPSLDFDARFTVSEKEILRSKDFAQMSAAEIEEARKLIKALVMPEDRAAAGASPPLHSAFASTPAAASAVRCSQAARSTWNFAAPASVLLRWLRSATFRGR